MRKQLATGLAGSIEFRPPEGPADAGATVEVYNPDGTVLVAEGAVDSTPGPNAITAIQIPAGSLTIALDDQSGGADIAEVNDDVWIGTAGETASEMHTVREAALDTITLYTLTRHEHDNGVNVLGSRLVKDLSAGNTATEGFGFRARWTYTVASGSTIVRWTRFDVVDRPFDVLLTATDLDLYLPGAVLDGAEDIPMSRLLGRARDKLFEIIDERTLRPSRSFDPSQFSYAAALAAGLVILERDLFMNVDKQDVVERMTARLDREIDRSLTAGLLLDKDDDGAVDSDELDTVARGYMSYPYGNLRTDRGTS